MAFAAQLEKEGFKADSIKSVAVVSLEKLEDGFAIPNIHLQVTAKIPRINQDEYNKIANIAKTECPVSKLMKAQITFEAILEK